MRVFDCHRRSKKMGENGRYSGRPLRRFLLSMADYKLYGGFNSTQIRKRAFTQNMSVFEHHIKK